MSDALFELGWDRPVYDGRPLQFTADPLTREQMQAMSAEWQHRQQGQPYRPARLWGGWMTNVGDAMPGHEVHVVHADLRCEWHISHPEGWPDWRRRPQCSCVGSLVYRAYCSCGWHSPIRAQENEVVEDWHDEHWPGWRDLPSLPLKMRPAEPTAAQKAAVRAWIEANYPPAFLEPGAPLVTERTPVGRRHVSSASPQHGFDLAGKTAYVCDVTWYWPDDRMPHALHHCAFNGPNHQRHECLCGCPEPAAEPDEQAVVDA